MWFFVVALSGLLASSSALPEAYGSSYVPSGGGVRPVGGVVGGGVVTGVRPVEVVVGVRPVGGVIGGGVVGGGFPHGGGVVGGGGFPHGGGVVGGGVVGGGFPHGGGVVGGGGGFPHGGGVVGGGIIGGGGVVGGGGFGSGGGGYGNFGGRPSCKYYCKNQRANSYYCCGSSDSHVPRPW
ncbi:uncharacterized protein LOC143024864 [Oratosquilla oratoria]|uniref:uncharacterized protein LOC143024864 n=1 Tax=Oratosquilla oratoria TaxID=337810 RepID=UPI003F7623BE